MLLVDRPGLGLPAIVWGRPSVLTSLREVMQSPPSNDDLIPDDPLLRNELAAPVREWSDWNQTLLEARSWFDTLCTHLNSPGAVERAMRALHRGLHVLRHQADADSWRRFCLTAARSHPLRELLHQCPFTRHGFERPRGYAGDAALLDYLYAEHPLSQAHPGRDIYRFMYQQASPRSVRERRERLAQEIDATAQRVSMPRILSVACGHLREAEFSRAVLERRIGMLLALDQDELSLTEIQRRFPGGPVRTVCSSIRPLLVGRLSFEPLDLIYSAGLYDYLPQAVAQRLTRRLFDMLRPGGRLLVANFSPSMPESGYLEAFMDWWLIYRDETEMLGLTAEVDPALMAPPMVYRDSEHNVIYMALTRR